MENIFQRVKPAICHNFSLFTEHLPFCREISFTVCGSCSFRNQGFLVRNSISKTFSRHIPVYVKYKNIISAWKEHFSVPIKHPIPIPLLTLSLHFIYSQIFGLHRFPHGGCVRVTK